MTTGSRSFLITGASKGIGRALSTRLADASHHVIGLARGYRRQHSRRITIPRREAE